MEQERTEKNAHRVDGLAEFPIWAAPAFEGHAGRLYSTPTLALDDKISNGLAASFPDQGNLNFPMIKFVDHFTENLEFWEKVLLFAKWRKRQGLGARK